MTERPSACNVNLASYKAVWQGKDKVADRNVGVDRYSEKHNTVHKDGGNQAPGQMIGKSPDIVQ